MGVTGAGCGSGTDRGGGVGGMDGIIGVGVDKTPVLRPMIALATLRLSCLETAERRMAV